MTTKAAKTTAAWRAKRLQEATTELCSTCYNREPEKGKTCKKCLQEKKKASQSISFAEAFDAAKSMAGLRGEKKIQALQDSINKALAKQRNP